MDQKNLEYNRTVIKKIEFDNEIPLEESINITSSISFSIQRNKEMEKKRIAVEGEISLRSNSNATLSITIESYFFIKDDTDIESFDGEGMDKELYRFLTTPLISEVISIISIITSKAYAVPLTLSKSDFQEA